MVQWYSIRLPMQGWGLTPGSGRSPGKEMATHSSILAWESHGQRSLVVYSPWGPKESDMT